MSDELITLVKAGEKIRVHPLSVPNHLQLGWIVLEKPEPAPVAETPVAAEPKETDAPVSPEPVVEEAPKPKGRKGKP